MRVRDVVIEEALGREGLVQGDFQVPVILDSHLSVL